MSSQTFVGRSKNIQTQLNVMEVLLMTTMHEDLCDFSGFFIINNTPITSNVEESNNSGNAINFLFAWVQSVYSIPVSFIAVHLRLNFAMMIKGTPEPFAVTTDSNVPRKGIVLWGIYFLGCLSEF